jgi:hypothetical protein
MSEAALRFDGYTWHKILLKGVHGAVLGQGYLC